METTLEKPQDVTIAVWRDPQHWRKDVFLKFTIWYITADGRHRWTDGTLTYWTPQNAQELLDDVLSKTTGFVRSKWVRVEVSLPNRDHYGHLVAGYIADNGVLLATRAIKQDCP